MRKIQLLTHAAVVTLCSLLLTSCNVKQDNPVPPQPGEKRYVLAELTESSDDATIKYDYSYDKDGRLTKSRIQQFFPDEQQNKDDIVEFIYEGNMITQMSTIQKEEYLMHLNADGLLEDYEFYNVPTDGYVHYLYTYDDAHRLLDVNEYGTNSRTLTWDGDDVVKITDCVNGEVAQTITIEPSEVETPGFYPWDLTGNFKPFYTLMGLYGKAPKHLPATWTSMAKAEIGSVQYRHSYTYTVTDGLLVECIEEKESEYNLGIIVQKTNETIKYTYVWKLL